MTETIYSDFYITNVLFSEDTRRWTETLVPLKGSKIRYSGNLSSHIIRIRN